MKYPYSPLLVLATLPSIVFDLLPNKYRKNTATHSGFFLLTGFGLFRQLWRIDYDITN